MSKRPATHIPAQMAPKEVLLAAQPHGGFTVGVVPGDYGRRGGFIASFTTLDEALDWLRANMAQPATEPQVAGKAVLS